METTRQLNQVKHCCLVVRTPDGQRTSISIPEADRARYIATCYGSQHLFRRHLNAAVLETSDLAGRTRSRQVRANLESRMLIIEQQRPAA